MSDTPLTDAQRHDPIEFYPMGGSGLGQMRKCADGNWVPAELAEKFERDNATLRAAFRWFRKYPEFVPNMETRAAEVKADIAKAAALFTD